MLEILREILEKLREILVKYWGNILKIDLVRQYASQHNQPAFSENSFMIVFFLIKLLYNIIFT